MATKKKKAKPFWERAYRGHAYWLGKSKLGKVTLLVDGGKSGGASGGQAAKGKYYWEAGGRAGHADTLEKAKAAVELAIFNADTQLDLFQQ